VPPEVFSGFQLNTITKDFTGKWKQQKLIMPKQLIQH